MLCTVFSNFFPVEKLANLKDALELHFAHYNFLQLHCA